MTKIGFFQLAGWERERLEKNESLKTLGAELFLSGDKLDVGLFLETSALEIISVFVDSPVDAVLLNKFPHLRFIATRSTGYDHIDLDACRARGIQVSNVPAYGENTVAEYTFALLLALTRKIYDAYDQIRETGSFNLDGLRGVDLQGKTLGVLGTGRIGRRVIQIASGFQMPVLAYDVHPDETAARALGFRYVAMEELLAESDIITLHMPQTADNLHFINAERLALMKKKPYLINTARGGLVDTMALVRALKVDTLRGVALDVLEEEGVTKDEVSFLTKDGHPAEPDLRAVLANHVLIDMPNVIITPHNAFNTQEALERIIETTVNNIKVFLAGQPENLVTEL